MLIISVFVIPIVVGLLAAFISHPILYFLFDLVGIRTPTTLLLSEMFIFLFGFIVWLEISGSHGFYVFTWKLRNRVKSVKVKSKDFFYLLFRVRQVMTMNTLREMFVKRPIQMLTRNEIEIEGKRREIRRLNDLLNTAWGQIQEQQRELERLNHFAGGSREEITRLTERVAYLEQELVAERAKSQANVKEPPNYSLKAETVYRRLAKKYHPDHNSQMAEVMKDINMLWTAMRR